MFDKINWVSESYFGCSDPVYLKSLNPIANNNINDL